MTAVVFSIGSNVGDRGAYLQTAVDVLSGALAGVEVSPVYETAPVGGPAQADYLNAVVVAQLPRGTDPLAIARAAESQAGRKRGERWGPRTLDVDVIAVGDLHSDDPALILPHPRARERAFVLLPWLDVVPEAILPGAGPVADLLADLDRTGVRRTDLVLAVR